MHPGVDRGFGHRQDGAGQKDPADDLEYELKIRHDTLPLLGAILHGQGKNRLNRNGFLTNASAMGCPFADIPEWHQ
jgi:hypothetical protein